MSNSNTLAVSISYADKSHRVLIASQFRTKRDAQAPKRNPKTNKSPVHAIANNAVATKSSSGMSDTVRLFPIDQYRILTDYQDTKDLLSVVFGDGDDWPALLSGHGSLDLDGLAGNLITAGIIEDANKAFRDFLLGEAVSEAQTQYFLDQLTKAIASQLQNVVCDPLVESSKSWDSLPAATKKATRELSKLVNSTDEPRLAIAN